MPLQDLIASLGGALGVPGGQDSMPAMGGGGMEPGGGMGMGPPGGLPEIPSGDSNELGGTVKSLPTQLSHIGAQLMSRGMHDAAISCAKAVKELEKVPKLIQDNAQQSAPPPNMGMSGMEQSVPYMPPTGPPPMPMG